jgi:hypothetical protein
MPLSIEQARGVGCPLGFPYIRVTQTDEEMGEIDTLAMLNFVT